MQARLFTLVALVLFSLALALIAGLAQGKQSEQKGGGAPPRRRADFARSPHVVVDTLNLAHWRGAAAPLSPAAIAATVDATAGALKLRHAGRVMYVLKDRETQLNDDAARREYQAAATRNGVYISAAERYADPPASEAGASAAAAAEHSSRGRDDFYMSVLAGRHRCAVVTGDRLRDFGRFRATVAPFHVVEFAYWREAPHREYIRPDAAAFARLRKPRTVSPAEYFGREK